MCSVKGCNVSKIHAKGLCKRHYEINRRFGTPYRRTVWDRNEIEIVDDYAEIYIYNNKWSKLGIKLPLAKGSGPFRSKLGIKLPLAKGSGPFSKLKQKQKQTGLML